MTSLGATAVLLGDTHRKYGLNRQDYATVIMSESVTIVVGADGCGSGRFVNDSGQQWELNSQSEVGAGILTYATSRNAYQIMKAIGFSLDNNTFQFVSEQVAVGAYRFYQGLLGQYYHPLSVLQTERDVFATTLAQDVLLSTLTVAIESGGNLAVFSFGDGAFRVYKDGNIVQSVCHDQNNMPNYPAYYAMGITPLNQFNWDTSTFFSSGEWDKFIAISDGGLDNNGSWHSFLNPENLMFGANFSPYLLQNVLRMSQEDGVLVTSDDLYVMTIEKNLP